MYLFNVAFHKFHTSLIFLILTQSSEMNDDMAGRSCEPVGRESLFAMDLTRQRIKDIRIIHQTIESEMQVSEGPLCTIS